MIFHANRNQKKAGVAILTSDNKDFKIMTARRDKGHYIVIKESIQEEVMLVNIYVSNFRVPQYIRQMLTAINGEININTIILGDLNTSLNTNGQIIWTENKKGNKGFNDN